MGYFSKQLLQLLLLGCVTGMIAMAQLNPGRQWNFDSDKPGAIALGFTNEVGAWKVAANASVPSKPNGLAQLAKSERPIYNIALATGTSYQNLDVSVQLLALAGAVDQGGGVVWRATDAKNYYIARYNPLEKNYRVYKVVEGQRTQLGTADVRAHEGWYTVRVVMKGDAIECYLDGTRHLEVKDGTFAAAGKIGLWTKADAQTIFDNLAVNSVQ